MIAEPFIVVELPDNVEYVEGSTFGGLVPVVGTSFANASEVAAYVKSVGYDALAGLAQDADVQFLVWTGDDIGTSTGTGPFGFDGTLTASGAVDFNVTYFVNGTEEFQSEVLSAQLVGSQVMLPAILNATP
jgi:hypothetical protein